MEAAPVTTQVPGVLLSLIVFALIGGLMLAIILLMRRLPIAARFALSLLLTGVVLLLVLVFYVRTASYAPPQPATVTAQAPPLMPPPPKVELPVLAPGMATVPSPGTGGKLAERPLEAEDSAPENSSAATIPEWINPLPGVPVRGDRINMPGTHRLVVVKSGPWASVDEAELHAYDEAASVATAEFRHLDPRGLGARLDVHRAEVRQTAVKQRFDEVTETNFGKFKAPMHQVWLQVELSPQLGERLAKPWREAAVDARLQLLTGCGMGLTAVFALTAFALRLDAARHGQQRTV